MKHDVNDLQQGAIKLTARTLKDVKVELLLKQNWGCAICGINLNSTPSRNVCVDHCHTTGFIRAVLCRNCNGSEGKVKTQATMCKRQGDQIGWLEQVVEYWKTHKVPQTKYIHPTHKTEEQKRVRRNARAKILRERKKNAL